MIHTSHSAYNLRINHPKDHGDVCNNEKPADENKVKLELTFFRTFAADKSKIQKSQRQQEEYAAEVKTNRDYVYPGMPLAVYGQRDKSCWEEIQENSCEIETGQNTADSVKGL